MMRLDFVVNPEPKFFSVLETLLEYLFFVLVVEALRFLRVGSDGGHISLNTSIFLKAGVRRGCTWPVQQ